MKKITGVVLALVTIITAGFAQAKPLQTFTLKEAVQFAIQNNAAAKNARISEQQAKARNLEIITTGLPQISANIDYTYYFKRPEVPALSKFFSDTTQSSARVFSYLAANDPNIANILYQSAVQSKDQKISFVLPHNLSTGLQVSQLIFDARYLFGIRATKDLLLTSRLSTEMSDIDITYNVTKAYYQAKSAQEAHSLLDSTLHVIQRLLGATRKTYQEGLIEELDVNRLELVEANLNSQIAMQKQMTEVALANLKYQMGLGLNDEVLLKDNMDELKAAANIADVPTFNAANRIEYKLLDAAVRLKGYDMAQKRSGYFPSLFGFLNYGWTAQTDKFGDIFKRDTQTYPDGDVRKISPWFSQGLVGVSLKLPIFDSGQKMAQVKQAKLDQQKTLNDMENFKNGAELQFRVAQSALSNALEDEASTKRAIELSEKIFKKNQIKFNEGVGNSFELAQSEQEFIANQLKYIQSRLGLLNAKADLDKALGKK